MGPMPPIKSFIPEDEKFPKDIKKIPAYLKKIITGFFSRLFYILKLVFKAAPLITTFLVIISVLNGLLPVATSYVAARLINLLAEAYVVSTTGGSVSLDSIIFYLILQFITIFAGRIFGHINTTIIHLAGEKVSNYVKEMMMKKAKELDIQSFDKPDFYERLENATREAGMRPLQILNSSFNMLVAVISIVSFVAVLFSVSRIAPFIIMVLSLPSAIITFAYRKKIFHYMRRRSKDRRQLNYYSNIMTNKDVVKEIRVFGLSDLFIVRYDNIFKKYYKGLKKLHIKEGIWSSVASLIASLVNCLLFLYIASMVWKGNLQIGDYSLYTGALNSIATGVGTIIAATSTIYEGTLFIDNLIVFMKEKITLKPTVKDPVIIEHKKPHSIELKNVSFKYPGSDRFVLKNISTKIDAGSTVSLVGLNGAGKTTLIKLITRLYDTTEGEILLDGKNIKEYELTELYKTFGIIFQDFGKYAVTVKENISFGNVGLPLSQNEVEKAAHQSNADDFIEKLAKGYDTPLMRYFEEDGIELSIGQWQKLSVARAFYGDNDILILDEPTASLDALAEQEIYNQFDGLRKGKTTIFVSHRLSSVTTSDKVLVIDNGELIEEGTHNELMKLKGTYYKLFSTQASRYIEEGKK